MAKVILLVDDLVLQEKLLSKERITIGRRPHNDIVIEDLAVSAEHAVIITILNDSFLEDLNSTNGTHVNGQLVKKHFLQNNDIIELPPYTLKFIFDTGNERNDRINIKNEVQRQVIALASNGHDFDFSQTLQVTGRMSAFQRVAFIKVLSGASAGKEIVLTKTLTTIGRPGMQVVAIVRRSQGYSITQVEGDACPLVNGWSIAPGEHHMKHGDVIDLCGTQMMFSVV